MVLPNRLSPRHRRVVAWIWAALIVTLTCVLWTPVRMLRAVGAVQDSVQRNYEISFWLDSGPDKPAALPASLDSAADRFFDYLHADTKGDTNLHILHHEQFRALFRGSIQDVHIYSPMAFRADLGAALEKFPDLRRVTVTEYGPIAPTEAQWTAFFRGLRRVPNLEEIYIAGEKVTDPAIVPLTGHPRLRTITFDDAALTAKSVPTLKTLPQLSKLVLGEIAVVGELPDAKALLAELRKARPEVVIESPWGEE